jgi:leucyl-tRNA synthetase
VIIVERQKMSKSRGNVITPDVYVSELGADAVRAYLMFVAPWEQGGEWNDSGISGISRWLNRVWNLVTGEYSQGGEVSPDFRKKAERQLSRLTHQTIKKVTQDLERIRFNTMIAALMEFTNYLVRLNEEGAVDPLQWQEAIDTLLLLLAPTVPHLAEELWQQTGHKYSIHNQSWPRWDEALAKEEEITLVVQVNGKLRDRVAVLASITEAEAKEKALGSQRVKVYLEGKEIINKIYVPGRLVNLVVR